MRRAASGGWGATAVRRVAPALFWLFILLAPTAGMQPVRAQSEGGVAADGVAKDAEPALFRSARLAGTVRLWSVKGTDSTVTLRQFVLPAEVEMSLGSRLRVRSGLEMRSARLSGAGTISSTALAGGWIDARHAIRPRWQISAGGMIPFRDPALTPDESRLASWLEETGIQMPGPRLFLEPSLEARVAGSSDLGRLLTGAAAAGVTLRFPYTAFRGGGDLDPGERLRLVLGVDGPVGGWRGSATVAAAGETTTRLAGADRYREGFRVQTDLRMVKPGNQWWQAEFGSYFQGKGEAVGGWPAPAAGSLVHGGLGLRGGADWRWTIDLSLWRSLGFGDLLDNQFTVQPGAGLARTVGAHQLEVRAVPAFGTAAGDRTLRGFAFNFSWGLGR